MDKSGAVYLNVGGTFYTTTREVLTRDQESVIGKMFSQNPSKWTTDRNGNVFIDRDGSLFRYILNFLRDDQLIVPTKFAEFDMLLQEAKAYEMKKLEEAILQLMSCRKIIVLLEEEFRLSPGANKMIQVQANEQLSQQLRENFKYELIERSGPLIDGLDWTTYYHPPAAAGIKMLLTELGFQVIKQQGSELTYVKDL